MRRFVIACLAFSTSVCISCKARITDSQPSALNAIDLGDGEKPLRVWSHVILTQTADLGQLEATLSQTRDSARQQALKELSDIFPDAKKDPRLAMAGASIIMAFDMLHDRHKWIDTKGVEAAYSEEFTTVLISKTMQLQKTEHQLKFVEDSSLPFDKQTKSAILKDVLSAMGNAKTEAESNRIWRQKSQQYGLVEYMLYGSVTFYSGRAAAAINLKLRNLRTGEIVAAFPSGRLPASMVAEQLAFRVFSTLQIHEQPTKLSTQADLTIVRPYEPDDRKVEASYNAAAEHCRDLPHPETQVVGKCSLPTAQQYRKGFQLAPHLKGSMNLKKELYYWLQGKEGQDSKVYFPGDDKIGSGFAMANKASYRCVCIDDK
jgi:hypothetical protein